MKNSNVPKAPLINAVPRILTGTVVPVQPINKKRKMPVEHDYLCLYTDTKVAKIDPPEKLFQPKE